MQKNKHQKKWNLKLLYASPEDPQIEQDLKTYDEKRRLFAEKYNKGANYLTEEEALLTALTDYEQLINDLNGAKPLMYFHYLSSIQANNTKAHAQLNRITTYLSKAHNELAFFSLKIGKVDPAHQSRFLQSKLLSKYHYFLKKRFDLAKYDLSENEEKILNLTDQTSYQMWVEGVEKNLNQTTISWNEKQLPVSEATQKVPQLPTKERRKLHTKILKKISVLAPFAEAEINAVVTYKNTNDELRGYSKPYSSRIIAAQNEPKVVLSLVETVTQNFNLAHRFYQLKAKLLKLNKLKYADRSAKINKLEKEYSFNESIDLVNDFLQDLNPQFYEIFQSMLANGQIDFLPRKNKVGGAFCSSSINNPTFVLLNHVNDFRSISTMAHEIGHAIHSELSKTQPVIYQSYSTSLAETASTFFEQLIFEKLVEKFDHEQKIVALHNKIQDDINTIFRQIAVFNFELELHQKIRSVGYLDHQQIGELLNKHMSQYLGPLFQMDQLDGNFFILWSHIRYYFYTYTYAFGHLVSKALAQQVKEKPNNIHKVIQILQAGSKATPKAILKEAGVDITQKDFFNKGIESIKKDIEKLELEINLGSCQIN